MLPSALPFTAADADRWVRAGLPRWVTSVALPALWALAFVVAVIADSTRCTPQDPSICGPDSNFALWFAVLLATPVLLWWMPLLGCLAGVAFALAELRYDDGPAARWAYGLHGLLCALVAVRLARGATEQRRIAAAASGGGRVGAIPGVPGDAAPSAVPRLAVAGLLVLAGIGLFAWYGHEVSGEQAHLDRAVLAQGRITQVSPNESVTVEVRTPAAGTREHQVGVAYYTDSYPLHSSTPVLVDPQDPDWIRLVAEPHDSTGWQTAGAVCFALAFFLVLLSQRWRRGLRALGSGEHPALRVRICPDDMGRALILPALDRDSHSDAERPFARLAVFQASLPAPPERGALANRWDEPDDWRYAIRAAFTPTWLEEAPVDAERFARLPGHIEPSGLVEDAVLVGELHDRGIAMLVTADAVLLPTGRLRAGRVRAGRVRKRPPRRPGNGRGRGADGSGGGADGGEWSGGWGDGSGHGSGQGGGHGSGHSGGHGGGHGNHGGGHGWSWGGWGDGGSGDGGGGGGGGDGGGGGGGD